MKILLLIDLEEAVLIDDKGKSIKGITGITTFKDGICVLTKNAMYTNVKSLLRRRAKRVVT